MGNKLSTNINRVDKNITVTVTEEILHKFYQIKKIVVGKNFVNTGVDQDYVFFYCLFSGATVGSEVRMLERVYKSFVNKGLLNEEN